MTCTCEYGFRPATLADLELLRRWQREPHVHAWWDDEDPYDEADVADPRVCRWIVSFGHQPIAYMQDYAVHGWGSHPFDNLPAGSRGIDQFIGPPDMIGKGHDRAFIRQRVQALFDQGVPVVATDPHPDNQRAIAAYERVGFRIAGPTRDTDWGRILPMEIRPLIGVGSSS
jgi:aminoglycoside 6'-N-acetyltransferase